MEVAGGLHDALDMLVHVGCKVGVGVGDLAELYAPVHRRAGLQRQAVG